MENLQIGNNSDEPIEQVAVNAQDMIERLRYDYRLFLALYLGDLMEMPSPEFHITLFSRMVSLEVPKSVYAIPRGFAKTTVARAVCDHIFIYSDICNVFYVSNTLAGAVPSVRAIAKFLKSANFEAIYGHVEFTIEQDGKGIYAFRMPNGKECYLQAVGANQQVRGTNIGGRRIELAIVDDLENRKDNLNDELYKSLKAWFYSDFIKALDRKHGKVIQIGNIVAHNSLVYEHCQSPYWHSMHFSAIKSDGTPLWEDMWSLEALIADFKEYQQMGQTSQWFGEMMNIIVPESAALINANEIVYRPKPAIGQIAYGFITVDPAISENQKTAHGCAVAVHGFYDNKWQIVDYFLNIGVDPIRLYGEIYRLASLWGVTYVGIENEGYQASLKYVFEYMQKREDCIHKMTFVQMPTGKKHKYTRIATWAGYLKRGEYTLTTGDIVSTNQLVMYDPTSNRNTDDLIDVEAYGVYMINNYLSAIVASAQTTHSLLSNLSQVIEMDVN